MSAEVPVFDRQSALDFLLGRINYERTAAPYTSGDFKLDRIRRLLAALGNPHLQLPAVHIAGTKGKGSTAAMMASILQNAGYKVGLYTSPHLQTLEERFVVNNQLCSEAEFVSLAATIQQAVHYQTQQAADNQEDPLVDLTFFEITTAMGLLHFARQKVDIAVLEVGLGGRLDSTNICLPEVCILTTISFDHTRQLGNTLALIAAEKAGIIKHNVPVVSGVVNEEPRAVIEKLAHDVGAPLLQRDVNFRVTTSEIATNSTAASDLQSARSFTYSESAPLFTLTDLRLSLLGDHQIENAAGAICASRQLMQKGWKISEQNIRDGLLACRPAGRIEQLSNHPAILIDVAHNVASVAAVVKTLKANFTQSRRILIFASSKDKDYAGMLQLLAPHFQHIILTRYLHNPRACEPEELAQCLVDLSQRSPGIPLATWEQSPGPPQALHRAQELSDPSALICATGSFFLAAELRPLLPPVRL